MSPERDDPQDELWREIEAAAPTLRRAWDSPRLWPRIAEALGAEQARAEARARRMHHLRRAAAAAVLVGVSLWGGLMSRRPPLEQALERPDQERRLLTDRALAEVESAEAAYTRSIDALAKVAQARLEDPTSPLLVSYREKIALLDAAIAECRTQIERNRFNAHLRRELLSIYQEKQRTLEQVMREEIDDRS